MNEGLVAEKRSLAALLEEAEPATVTKSGERYAFDTLVLALLGKRLPEDLRRKLRLPIQFRLDTDAGDSGYTTDQYAAEALKELGEISALREFTGGRLWVSKPIIYAIIRKYPTVVQVGFG